MVSSLMREKSSILIPPGSGISELEKIFSISAFSASHYERTYLIKQQTHIFPSLPDHVPAGHDSILISLSNDYILFPYVILFLLSFKIFHDLLAHLCSLIPLLPHFLLSGLHILCLEEVVLKY